MCRRPAVRDDPLINQFAEYAEYFVDHPPPPQMLWILVETMKNTADIVSVLEDRRAEEARADEGSSRVR